MGRIVWLIEKRRGVRVSALSDDAHGMVTVAKSHDYENPSDEKWAAPDFEAAEAAREANRAATVAEQAQKAAEPQEAQAATQDSAEHSEHLS